MTAKQSASEAPLPSCTNGWVAFAGLAGFFLALALVAGSGLDPVHQAFAALAATALPMILLDLALVGVHRRRSTGLAWDGPAGEIDAGRIAVKLLGFAGTLAAIGLCYWLLPVYRDDFYAPWWEALRQALPLLALGALPYFVWIDRRMVAPRDGYWMAGMALLGRFEQVDRAMLWQYVLGWIIKGYFLPLMFAYLVPIIGDVTGADIFHGKRDFLAFYRFAWDLAFAVDLVVVTAGYSLTLRLIDSHIRSSEPTMLGWVVALVCYQPFWNLAYNRYFAYEDDVAWSGWLAGLPALQMLWGVAIMALLAIYAWANLVFGCRFSNLTHRGILTNGPFRWTKHPSYLAKNLIWWLVSVPFVSTAGPAEALRHCLLLLGVNFIYILRARTEERHLSRDPDYVAYALWIERHGLLRGLGQAIPALRYVPPAGSDWKPAE